ncbi:MAG: sugar phosphate isomerase/epimerase [Sedimentisphaerales bacterium]|nr:sugar phosphate isomerase/epimerase [Sedimentisphaerales bacterium]
MNVGFLTACLNDVSLPEVARWAAESGFAALEVPCRASGAKWFDGAAIVPAKVDDAAAAEAEQLLAATGLHFSCLTTSDNLLEPDESRRQRYWQLLIDTIRAAAKLRVKTVSCRIGRNPATRIGECIAAWGRMAAEAIAVAEECDVRIAVENSPMVGWQTEDAPGNLAFSPELWEKIFTHAHSDTVGLNFDPAPLVWLEVDYVEAVTAYAEYIFHVRANDVEVFADRRSDCSVLRPNGGWWRRRMPGHGQVAWPRLISRLQENRYNGSLSIAYDDPVFNDSQDAIKRGLVFGRRFLERYIV